MLTMLRPEMFQQLLWKMTGVARSWITTVTSLSLMRHIYSLLANVDLDGGDA